MVPFDSGNEILLNYLTSENLTVFVPKDWGQKWKMHFILKTK
jgi:hypothetical protein